MYDFKISSPSVKSDTGSNMASSARGIQIGSAWFQRKINLRPQHRGVHLVSEEILRQIPELAQFSVGLCHVQSECSSLTFYTAVRVLRPPHFISQKCPKNHTTLYFQQITTHNTMFTTYSFYLLIFKFTSFINSSFYIF